MKKIKKFLCVVLSVMILSTNVINGHVSAAKISGILNVGNSCYMNSAVQILHASDSFVGFIKIMADLFREQGANDKITVRLDNLFDRLNNDNQDLINEEKREEIRAMIVELVPGLYNGGAGYTEAAVMRILDGVKEECGILDSFIGIDDDFKFENNVTYANDFYAVEKFKTSAKELYEKQGKSYRQLMIKPYKVNGCVECLEVPIGHGKQIYYDLKAVSFNTGGHYVTYVLGDDRQWYLINDSNKKCIGSFEEMRREAGDLRYWHFVTYEAREPNLG